MLGERDDDRLEDILDDLEAARQRLDNAYATGADEQELALAWSWLESLRYEREVLRHRYASELQAMQIAAVWDRLGKQLDAKLAKIAEAFAEMARRMVEPIRRFTEAVDRYKLAEKPNPYGPGPRHIFIPTTPNGPGPIGPAQYARALPATRRPTRPGFMKQKGRG